MSDLAQDMGLRRTVWARSAKEAREEAPLVVEALADVGSLIAEAKAEVDNLAAAHRHWRGTAMVDLSTRFAKMTEWKTRSTVEADPAYISHHRGIAEATERLDNLEGIRAALLEKARLIAAVMASAG